jgi:2-succinyl-6-hydroxy-2,4-cyclohexadiene-1-carboxylate synthase
MAKTIEIQGFPHRYELSAPPSSPIVLVFVHGWLLSRAYWQPLVQQLSSTYQCLTYDLRGFGESQADSVPIGQTANQSVNQKANQPASLSIGASVVASDRVAVKLAPPSTQYAPASYAKDLSLLLQQLNIQKAWLVGHSLGGSIALWAADQMPQTVAGVICVNSGGGIYLKEEFERFRTAGQLLVRLRPLWLAKLPLLSLSLLSLPLCYLNVAKPLASRWGKQRLLDLVAAQSAAALGTLLDSTTEAEVHQLPQVVARLQQPVHFIAGANDTMIEPQYVRHLASFHPSFDFCGNNVSEIANCGHMSMVEQPEAVTEEIRAILANYT